MPGLKEKSSSLGSRTGMPVCQLQQLERLELDSYLSHFIVTASYGSSLCNKWEALSANGDAGGCLCKQCPVTRPSLHTISVESTTVLQPQLMRARALLLLLWALSEAVDDSLLPGTVDLLVLILEKTQSV